MKRFPASFADGAFFLLVLLMPLKLGTLALMPETSNFFPEQAADYLVVSWSPALFGVFAGAALLLQLAAALAERKRLEFDRVELFFSVLPLLGGAPGFWGAENRELALQYFVHLLSLSAFFAAAAVYSRRAPASAERFAAALGAGTVALGFLGLHQYFFGFRELREYIAERIARGEAIPEPIMARVNDDRVYASFTSCNNLAGYLLLVIPPAAVWLWQKCGKIRPAKYSRLFLALPVTFALTAVLLTTKSRAAMLSLAIGGAAAASGVLKIPRRAKFALLVLILLSVAAGGYYIRFYGRGFLSMEARADYVRSAALLWTEHPVAGAGWGEFFYAHMRKKQIESAEAAHDPHNIFLSFASQAGTWGLLASLLMLLTPLVALYRQKDRSPAGTAALLGGGLWVIHSCMDVNFLYPASFGMFGALMIVSCRELRLPSVVPSGAAAKRFFLPAFLLAAAAGAGAAYGSMHIFRGERLLYDFTREPYASATEEYAAFERLRKQRPYSSVPYFLYGDMLLRRNDLAGAERCYHEAVSRERSRPSLYWQLGKVAERRGDADGAEAYRAEARKLFPRNPEYRASK